MYIAQGRNLVIEARCPSIEAENDTVGRTQRDIVMNVQYRALHVQYRLLLYSTQHVMQSAGIYCTVQSTLCKVTVITVQYTALHEQYRLLLYSTQHFMYSTGYYCTVDSTSCKVPVIIVQYTALRVK